MLVNHLVKSIPIKANTGLRLGYLWVLIIWLIGLLIWQPRVYGAEQPVGLETADPTTLNGKVEAVEAVEIVEPDEPADPKTANSDQGADQAPDQAPDQAAPEDPAKPSSKKAKNDSRRFVPSESISEDLAVSFPVDI